MDIDNLSILIDTLATGTIDKHRLQHFTSYVPDQQKLANIIGAVTRHSGYQMPSFRPFQSAISTLQFISVLAAESYPMQFISEAFQSVPISRRLSPTVLRFLTTHIQAWRRPFIKQHPN